MAAIRPKRGSSGLPGALHFQVAFHEFVELFGGGGFDGGARSHKRRYFLGEGESLLGLHAHRLVLVLSGE